MSKYIYLYGRGETNTNVGNRTKTNKKPAAKSSSAPTKSSKTIDEQDSNPALPGVEQISVKGGCYLKCEIPDQSGLVMSGFFPSVLHAYIMYAKDIGLKVTDMFCDKNLDSEELMAQLVYSLWPLFYVNHSSIFTSDAVDSGLNIWTIEGQTNAKLSTQLLSTIKMDSQYAIFYQEQPSMPLAKEWAINSNQAANPIPAPGNVVNATGPWYLLLNLPVKDSGQASSYAIIQNYNRLVVWDTIVDMQLNVDKGGASPRYKGLKQATGSVIKAVMDRDYAYDPIMPRWNPSWGIEPPEYQAKSLSTNNYNIGASLFVSDKRVDPSVAEMLKLCTALNIKGKVKSGHAETRLLLSLDAVDNANKQISYSGGVWFAGVCDFYEFDASEIQIKLIYSYYKKMHISLVSSLKPCYMCTGEVDASSDGLILSINGRHVEMWACFPNLEYKPKIKKVLYFDVDRPISYPSYLQTSIQVDGSDRFSWEIYLAPWTQWAAFMNSQPSSYTEATSPIGPRVVEPAGECLKTGEAFNRYKNSERLLSQTKSQYLDELTNLLVGIGHEVVDDYVE